MKPKNHLSVVLPAFSCLLAFATITRCYAQLQTYTYDPPGNLTSVAAAGYFRSFI